MNDQYRRRRVKYAELEVTSMNDNKRHSDRRVKKTKKAIQDALMTLMDKKKHFRYYYYRVNEGSGCR